VYGAIIAEGFERILGKLLVGAFQFLQADDIGRSLLQPAHDGLDAAANRIHVPGGDFHFVVISSQATTVNRVPATWRPNLLLRPIHAAMIVRPYDKGGFMSLSDLASIGNLIGGIAVLASLAYLSLQVRQNTRHTRALIEQGRATRVAEFNLSMCQAPTATIEAYLAAIDADPGLTDDQEFRFYSFSRASFFDAQDSFRQHLDGLLGEDAYDGLMSIMRVRFASPGMRAAWKAQRETFTPQFRSLMDDLVRTTPVRTTKYAPLKKALLEERTALRRQ
jgi:hypothetical protein